MQHTEYERHVPTTGDLLGPEPTSLADLAKHIKALAVVPASEGPFISCYLDLSTDEWRNYLAKQTQLYRKLLKKEALSDFNQCIAKIEDWLLRNQLASSKGVAFFARGSHHGYFWLPMQFSVPLPNAISIYPTPNIYHLIELKDNFHSYVLLISKPEGAYILEVNLGDASIQSWVENPTSYRRVGSEWSKLHYQVTSGDRGTKYHQEKIKVIRRLMKKNKLSHLIISGNPENIKRLKYSLPPDLKDKLIDVVPSQVNDQGEDIVLATLSTFLEHEEFESQQVADKLIKQLSGENLAVVGSLDTIDALIWGEVDVLVMSSKYNPYPGWRCQECKMLGIHLPATDSCSHCHKKAVKPFDVKEAILRLASQQDIDVEIVDHHDGLMAVGGVGCLLRYR